MALGDAEGEEETAGESEAQGIVLEGVCDAFQAAHGREPTDEDLQTVLTNMQKAAPALKAAQREDAAAENREQAKEAEKAEEIAEDDAGDVLAQLIALFKEQNGKEPTEEHLKQWTQTISEVATQEGSQKAADDQEAGAGNGKKRTAAAPAPAAAPLDLGLDGLFASKKAKH